jgi:hypothetical protein
MLWGEPGVTHNPDKPPLACVNNLRIVSTNRCSGNINTNTMHKGHKDLRGKPPQGEEGKTTGVDQPVHASFTMSNLGTESL